MSEQGVSMNVSIADGISPAIASLLRAVQNPEPMLDEIGASQVSEVQTRFEAQRGPDGTKWKELSAVTLKRRTAKSPKILSVTRTLYDSYLHKVGNSEVTVGSNYRTARIHNLGGKAGRGLKVTIPARPQLGISAAGREEINAIIADHLGGAA